MGKSDVISSDSAKWYHVMWQVQASGEPEMNAQLLLYLDGVLVDERHCFLDPTTWSEKQKLQLGNVDAIFGTYPAAPSTEASDRVCFDDFKIHRGIVTPPDLMAAGVGMGSICSQKGKCLEVCRAQNMTFTGVWGEVSCQCARKQAVESSMCAEIAGVVRPDCAGDDILITAFSAIGEHSLVGSVTDTGPWKSRGQCAKSCEDSSTCNCFGAWALSDLVEASPQPRCYHAVHPCEVTPAVFRASRAQPSSPDEKDAVFVLKAASCVRTCGGGMFPTFAELPCVNEGALVLRDAGLSFSPMSFLQQRSACGALAISESAAGFCVDHWAGQCFLHVPESDPGSRQCVRAPGNVSCFSSAVSCGKCFPWSPEQPEDFFVMPLGPGGLLDDSCPLACSWGFYEALWDARERDICNPSYVSLVWVCVCVAGTLCLSVWGGRFLDPPTEQPCLRCLQELIHCKGLERGGLRRDAKTFKLFLRLHTIVCLIGFTVATMLGVGYGMLFEAVLVAIGGGLGIFFSHFSLGLCLYDWEKGRGKMCCACCKDADESQDGGLELHLDVSCNCCKQGPMIGARFVYAPYPTHVKMLGRSSQSLDTRMLTGVSAVGL